MVSIYENSTWKQIAQILVPAIEPSMDGRRSYLLDSEEAARIEPEFDCRFLNCGAWTSRSLDVMLYPYLISRNEWLGRTFAAVVDSQRVRSLEKSVGFTLHEFCHYLTDQPGGMIASVENAERILRMFKEPSFTALPVLKSPWEDHGLDFVRAACHVCYRAMNYFKTLRLEHMIVRYYYGDSVNVNDFMRPMLLECATRKKESIRSILKTPAPREFVQFWHNVTGTPMPEAPVKRFAFDARVVRSASLKADTKLVVLIDGKPKTKDGITETCDPSGFQLPTLPGASKPNDRIAVMRNRTSNSAADIVGSVRNIQVQGGQVVGILELAKGETYAIEEFAQLDVKLKPIEYREDGPNQRTILKYELVRLSMPKDASPAQQLATVARRMPKSKVRNVVVRSSRAESNGDTFVVLMDETVRKNADGVRELYLLDGYEPRPNHPSISMVSSSKSQSVRDVVGSVRSIQVQGNQLVGIASWAKDAQAQKCRQKHLDAGMPMELQVNALEGWDVGAGQHYNGIPGPLLVVTRWQPLSVAMTGNDIQTMNEHNMPVFSCDCGCTGEGTCATKVEAA